MLIISCNLNNSISKCYYIGRLWAAQHPHCMRCAYIIYLHSVYNAGTVKPILMHKFYNENVICCCSYFINNSSNKGLNSALALILKIRP